MPWLTKLVGRVILYVLWLTQRLIGLALSPMGMIFFGAGVGATEAILHWFTPRLRRRV